MCFHYMILFTFSPHLVNTILKKLGNWESPAGRYSYVYICIHRNTYEIHVCIHMNTYEYIGILVKPCVFSHFLCYEYSCIHMKSCEAIWLPICLIPVNQFCEFLSSVNMF